MGILPGVSLTRAHYFVVNPETRDLGSLCPQRGSRENGMADMELGSEDETTEAAIGSRPYGEGAGDVGDYAGGRRQWRTGRGLARLCER